MYVYDLDSVSILFDFWKVVYSFAKNFFFRTGSNRAEPLKNLRTGRVLEVRPEVHTTLVFSPFLMAVASAALDFLYVFISRGSGFNTLSI